MASSPSLISRYAYFMPVRFLHFMPEAKLSAGKINARNVNIVYGMKILLLNRTVFPYRNNERDFSSPFLYASPLNEKHPHTNDIPNLSRRQMKIAGFFPASRFLFNSRKPTVKTMKTSNRRIPSRIIRKGPAGSPFGRRRRPSRPSSSEHEIDGRLLEPDGVLFHLLVQCRILDPQDRGRPFLVAFGHP